MNALLPLPTPEREVYSRSLLTRLRTVKHIHAALTEQHLAIVVALRNWGPAQVAEITGVSPALQRQWRKQGVLTPLTEREKRSKFTVILLGYVWAARVLIDHGAGHREIGGLVNNLGYEIFTTAMRMGRWRVRDPVTEEQARDAVVNHPMMSMGIGHRYFAFRNDPEAIGSPHRADAFFHLDAVGEWLRAGKKLPEQEDIEAEEAERRWAAEQPPLESDEDDDEDDGWEPPPPAPPLAPGRAAVVVDIEAVTRELVERAGNIGDVYDDESDARFSGYEAVKLEVQEINREIEAGLEKLEQLQAAVEAAEGSAVEAAVAALEAYRDAFYPRFEELHPKLQKKIELMKLHLELVKAEEGGPDLEPDPDAAAKIAKQINDLKDE